MYGAESSNKNIKLGGQKQEWFAQLHVDCRTCVALHEVQLLCISAQTRQYLCLTAQDHLAPSKQFVI